MLCSPSLSQCLEQNRDQYFLDLRNNLLESGGNYLPKIALSPFVCYVAQSPQHPCQGDTIMTSFQMTKLCRCFMQPHIPPTFRLGACSPTPDTLDSSQPPCLVSNPHPHPCQFSVATRMLHNKPLRNVVG